jgi:tetratricopeptide (TPR) repeat protein
MTVFAVPMLLYFAGRPDEAAAEAVHNLELFEPFPIGAILHGYALEAVGATKRAIREYNRALGMGFFPDAVARLGHAYGTMGDRPKALSYLQELHDAEEDGKIAYVSGYLEALIHVGLGDHHQALTCLENSLAQRCDWLIYLNVEPCWRDLRKYDQFQMLARKVGLTITGAL